MNSPSHDRILQHALQHHRAGRLADAAQLYQQLLAQNPHQPTALHMLGVLAGQSGQWSTAVDLIRRSILLAPNESLAHSNLGKLLYDHGDFADAIAASRQAVNLDPHLAEAQYNLGNALYALNQIDQAIDCYHRAIALRPDYAKAHHNLANAHKDRAELNEAVAAARRVVELCPHIPESHSNLIFTMLFHHNADPLALRAESENFNRRHALPLAASQKSPTHARAPHDPLRIGYLSPDFREHCQSLFTIPLFAHHDHTRFHITAYSDVRRPDTLTERLRGYCDQWRSTAGLDHAALADLIRADRIDILVDLTMHMANNRLLVFARKPAPVQVSWLAFPGTTGLSAIDYRLTDPHLDPPPGAPDSHDHFYTEKSLRLPETFWCYDPLSDLPINTLPAMTNNFTTFGCLNNFAKITDETLRIWAQILRQIPRSRLLLLAPEGLARQHVLQILGARLAGQVHFQSFLPRGDYLKLYHQIDIALDTFPVNGHTTSLDALWMGVPVVTRYGANPLSRAGLSQLTNLSIGESTTVANCPVSGAGLPRDSNLPPPVVYSPDLSLQELIAASPQQYVDIACALSQDWVRLAALRHDLRARMQNSPLMNAQRFTQNVEAAYQQMAITAPQRR